MGGFTIGTICKEDDDGEEKRVGIAINWLNLRSVIFTQSLPILISLILTSVAFKFALKAQMNQGIVTSFNTMTGIYAAIVFHFAREKVISSTKIAGMILMIPCVFLYLFDIVATDDEMYGFFAIELAFIIPLCFAFKSYFITNPKTAID